MTIDVMKWLQEVRKLDGAPWAESIHYDPETGLMHWLRRPESHFLDARTHRIWNTKYAGKPAGARMGKLGYMAVTLNKERKLLHRVAWFLSFGAWPSGTIDHINGDPSDNRLKNLRDVTHAENMRNVKVQSNNTSGIQGVYWHRAKSKWAAEIRVLGRKKSLGYFDCIQQAARARQVALLSHGFHENHGRMS